MSGERITADVAIVGAGLAGLAAARAVAAAGKRPVVLEARDRVGGRTLNEPIGGGKVVEIGGQWVGPGQKRVLGLIEELGLETFPTYGEGRNLFERAGRIRGYEGTIPRVSPLALAETAASLSADQRDGPDDRPRAPLGGAEGRELGLADLRHLDGQTGPHPDRPRPDAAGDLGGVGRRARGRLAAQRPLLHPLGGVVRGPDRHRRAARRTRGWSAARRRSRCGWRRSWRTAVVLDAPVRRIEHARGIVTVSTAGGVAVEAWRAIVALPPVLAGRIEYDPPMPAVRDGLTQRMAMGSVVKCMAVYPEPFWRAEGLSGQVTSADGPVSVTYDNSPPDGSPGVLLAFLEGAAARAAADLPQPERRAIVLGCLERFFGPRAAEPERYLDKAWAADPYSAGCYGGFLPTGAWRANGPALRAPVGPIHWAGAETATVWSGYMDGAISSGERAAAEALAAMGG